MREYHNVEYANPLVSTNPCAEQPLAAYTACNLGSINLAKFVDESGEFDYEELAEVARTATRFLDDVIDYNMDAHALEKIRAAVSSDRRIGLGITASPTRSREWASSMTPTRRWRWSIDD